MPAIFDRRLFEVDIRASVAHCNGLVGAGILSVEVARSIKSGLQTIECLDTGIGITEPRQDAPGRAQTLDLLKSGKTGAAIAMLQKSFGAGG